MTYEEAYEFIMMSSEPDKYDVSPNVLFDANEMVWEACAKADKYRWHDLRKKPDDLPVNKDDSVMYECVLENHVHDASYPAFYFCEEIKAFGYPNSPYAVANGANDFETIDDMKYEKVIAWREIEPFEEVEE